VREYECDNNISKGKNQIILFVWSSARPFRYEATFLAIADKFLRYFKLDMCNGS